MVTALFVFFCNYLVARDFDNFASLVETTFGANRMRQAHGATVRADVQIARFEEIVGTTAVTAAFGNFTFWQRGHESFSLIQASGAARCHF